MSFIKNLFKLGCLLPAGILIPGLLLYAFWSNFLTVRMASFGACDRDAGCLYTTFNGRRSVAVLGFSADDSRFLTVGQGSGRIHAASDGSVLTRLNPGRESHRYRISGDRSEIVAYRGDSVKVLDWEGQIQRSWTPAADATVRNVATLPLLNGFLVAEADGLAVRHGNGDLVTWLVEGGSFLQVTATPDGEYIAAYDFVDDELMVWPLQNLGAGIVIPEVEALSIHLSADGALVAAGGAPGAYVWDTRDGSVVLDVVAPDADTPVTATALREDGTQLAVGFADGTVTVFDLATQAPVKQFTHRHSPRYLSFDGSGDRLAVGLDSSTRVSGGEQVFRNNRDPGEFRPGSTLRQSDNRISTTPGYVLVWAIAD